MDKAVTTTEELVAFGQGNLEAFVKAGQIWATGMQDLSRTVAATAQAQLDETLATVKAFAGVKTLKDAVDLQATLARASVEKAMAETGKLTDAGLKLAEQALAPLTARVSLAVEKFGRTA
jgi:phasin family protein